MNFQRAFILIGLIIYANAQSDCFVNIDCDMTHHNCPILLKNTNIPELLYGNYRTNAKVVHVAHGSTIKIFCTQSTDREGTRKGHLADMYVDNQIENHFVNLYSDMEKPVPIKCENGAFTIDQYTVPISDLACEFPPNSLMEKDESRSCTKGSLYKIGFYVEQDSFLETMHLCFDETNTRTYWVKALIQPLVGGGRQTARTFEFKKGIPDIWLNQLDHTNIYNRNNQRESMRELLGENSPSYDQIRSDTNYILTRGHLIAKADKIYYCEQESTYFLANAAPQWHIINAYPGNWNRVEIYIQRYARRVYRPIHVWTGTIGILKLKNSSNIENEVFLHDTAREAIDPNAPTVPVPAAFYKCVLYLERSRALCFITINNPFISRRKEIFEPNSIYKFCNPLNCPITDLDRRPKYGVTYCCDINDFITKNYVDLGLEDLRSIIHSCGHINLIDISIDTTV